MDKDRTVLHPPWFQRYRGNNLGRERNSQRGPVSEQLPIRGFLDILSRL